MIGLLTFLLVTALACLTASLWWNWRQTGEIQELTEARHAKPRARAVEGGARPDGTAAAAPAGRPRTSLIDAAPRSAQAAYADAVHALSAPYLPEVPQARQSLSRADLPPVRTVTPGRQPWETASFPELTAAGVDAAREAADARDAAAERDRATFVRAQLAEHPDADPAELGRVLAGLRRVPAEPVPYVPEVAS